MSEQGDLLLRAEQVGLTFSGREILADVSLSLHGGEILVLIGPNGAGKSTLIRVLLGLQRAERGRVERATSLRIGYMPQRVQIDPVLPLTVSRFLSLSGERNRTRLEAVLDEVGVARVINSPLQGLSGGEFQRVLLARTMLREPQLLILDEPVQGVDVNGQAELYGLIGRLRDEHGYGIMMVSHDLHLVMASADKVVCLDRHVCCSGHPRTVCNDPAYIELFGTQAASNLALYTHHHNHLHSPDGSVVGQRKPECEGCEHHG